MICIVKLKRFCSSLQYNPRFTGIRLQKPYPRKASFKERKFRCDRKGLKAKRDELQIVLQPSVGSGLLRTSGGMSQQALQAHQMYSELSCAVFLISPLPPHTPQTGCTPTPSICSARSLPPPLPFKLVIRILVSIPKEVIFYHRKTSKLIH